MTASRLDPGLRMTMTANNTPRANEQMSPNVALRHTSSSLMQKTFEDLNFVVLGKCEEVRSLIYREYDFGTLASRGMSNRFASSC